MLEKQQALELKKAGLTAYNHNLDTSREYCPNIITTRTYDERLETLKHVREAGINVCSGICLKNKTCHSPSFLQYCHRNKYPSFSSPQNTMAEGSPKSLYDFTVKDILGSEVPLSNYRGKVLLIVNVASKCGLTDSNYKELNVLYEKYKDQGFEILAFPCNQFLWQEPGTNEEILQTVCTRFKAEFPVFEKVDVNGDKAAPLYKFLKSEKGGFLGNVIKHHRFSLRKTYKICWDPLEHRGLLKIEDSIRQV
ncbi:hypothetical protein K7X08_031851 [Anisodus acutangulus]|uniref:Glutathione peroxidase n=1 Tax=Anisodus acutangulus TaxID=402998 RepID=A0A9Q1MQV2_9SOLA|nr:hypothetical protein K7X08_031851 [Anisodus acutangulus]